MTRWHLSSRRALFLATSFALSAPMLYGSDADAKRRIVGGEGLEDEEKKDAEEEKKKAKKKKKENKKKSAEQKKAAEKKKKAKEAAKKKRAAAKKAAEAAAKKKKEEAERKKKEKEDREQRRLDDNRSGRLKQAKAERSYSRADGAMVAALDMIPGAPKPGKVVELRLDLGKTLKVASPRYGNRQPMLGARIVAEVAPPETGDEDEAKVYRMHALEAPGSYGVHFTPSREGAHPVIVRGKTADGDAFQFTLDVHAGVWPPPDLEEEEAKNAKARTAGGGRRIAGD